MKNYITPNMVCLKLQYNDVIMNSPEEVRVAEGIATALSLDWGEIGNAP